MEFPNKKCGQCPYWFLFGEPEISEEENQEIWERCKICMDIKENNNE